MSEIEHVMRLFNGEVAISVEIDGNGDDVWAVLYGESPYLMVTGRRDIAGHDMA